MELQHSARLTIEMGARKQGPPNYQSKGAPTVAPREGRCYHVHSRNVDVSLCNFMIPYWAMGGRRASGLYSTDVTINTILYRRIRLSIHHLIRCEQVEELTRGASVLCYVVRKAWLRSLPPISQNTSPRLRWL